MNTIDIIILIILGIGFFRGLWKGFILEITSFLAIGLGIYGAIYFSFYVSDYMRANFNWDEQTIKIVAFAFTLLGIMFIIGILGRILTKIFEIAALGFVNRVFGGIFGVLKWSLIIGTSFQFLTSSYTPVIPQKVFEKSILYKPVSKLSDLAYSKFFTKQENTSEIKNILP